MYDNTTRTTKSLSSQAEKYKFHASSQKSAPESGFHQNCIIALKTPHTSSVYIPYQAGMH